MAEAVSSRGRTYTRVDFTGLEQEANNNSSQSKSKPKPKLLLQFDSPVSNTLHEAVKAGFKPSLPNGRHLILAIKSICKQDGQFKITGKYAVKNGNNIKTTETTQNSQSQPMPLLTEILSLVKDLSPEHDISNELFEKLTKNLRLPLDYLKYKRNEEVLLRPGPKYARNGNKIYFDPVPATVTAVIPHSHAGDISAEYEVDVAPNNAGIRGGAVHEAYLRERNWSDSPSDKFETTVTDVLLYEAERALNLKLFGYLDDCGIDTKLMPYLDINSAFFGNKSDWIACRDNSSDEMLLKLCDIKVNHILNALLPDLAPQANNFIKNVEIKNKADLRKYGKSFECVEMDAIMKKLIPDASESKDESESNIVFVSDASVWLVFSSVDEIKMLCSVKEIDFKTTLSRGTTVKLLCDNVNQIQFVWDRKDKLLSLNKFKYQTSIL